MPAGLDPADVESRGMGQNGVDIILTPAAKRVLDLDIETKAVEALNIFATFCDHYTKYKDSPALKLLTHTKNRKEMLVTLRWADFLPLLKLRAQCQ